MPTTPRHGTLSDTELRTLQLIAQGYTATEAAAAREVSVNTVKHHLRRAYAKLGAWNAVHAVTTMLAPHGVTIAGGRLTPNPPPGPTR